jgi:hypothetical protein
MRKNKPNKEMKTPLFLMLFMLLPVSVLSQIKIGDITISDSLAREYFLDCYKKSDTITVQELRDKDPYRYLYSEKGCAMSDAWFNDIVKKSIGTIYSKSMPRYPKAYLIARTPSAYDFGVWMVKKKGKR